MNHEVLRSVLRCRDMAHTPRLRDPQPYVDFKNSPAPCFETTDRKSAMTSVASCVRAECIT